MHLIMHVIAIVRKAIQALFLQMGCQAPKSTSGVRLSVEMLESRCAPAGAPGIPPDIWVGGAGLTWNDAAAWNLKHVPGANERAVFATASPAATLPAGATIKVGAVLFAKGYAQRLDLNHSTLIIQQSLTDDGGTIANGTIMLGNTTAASTMVMKKGASINNVVLDIGSTGGAPLTTVTWYGGSFTNANVNLSSRTKASLAWDPNDENRGLPASSVSFDRSNLINFGTLTIPITSGRMILLNTSLTNSNVLNLSNSIVDGTVGVAATSEVMNLKLINIQSSNTSISTAFTNSGEVIVPLGKSIVLSRGGQQFGTFNNSGTVSFSGSNVPGAVGLYSFEAGSALLGVGTYVIEALREIVWVTFEGSGSLFPSFPGQNGLPSSRRTCHDARMAKLKRLLDIYRFPGFVPRPKVRGIFGDPSAVVITLQRRRKKRPAGLAGAPPAPTTTSGRAGSATCPVATSAPTSTSPCAGSSAPTVAA